MEINLKTKFNIGDHVWVMEHNRPIERKVNRIHLHSFIFDIAGKDKRDILEFHYELCDIKTGNVVPSIFYEDRPICATKEELIGKLFE